MVIVGVFIISKIWFLDMKPIFPPPLGDCTVVNAIDSVPDDFYKFADIIDSDEYAPFTKHAIARGITLLGRNSTSNISMYMTAELIEEMFPEPRPGYYLDLELQKDLLTNMYKYRTAIPIYSGESDKNWSPEE